MNSYLNSDSRVNVCFIAISSIVKQVLTTYNINPSRFFFLEQTSNKQRVGSFLLEETMRLPLGVI